MRNTNFPKVLFITPVAFNSVTGGGITFSNLFRGWPKDFLATVHNDPEPVTTNVCELFYDLGPDDIDLVFPFNFLRSTFSTARKLNTTCDGSSIPSPKSRFFRIVKHAFLSLTGNSFPERAKLTPELEKWIADYNPDVIYTILGGNGLMDLIEQVRIRFDLPIVIHIMDDWIQTAHQTGVFARTERAKTFFWIEHFLNVATTRLGISPAMCKAYQTRYGFPFEPFQNTIENDRWHHVLRDKSQTGNPLDLLYVGSIFPDAQLDSLANCCEVVADINNSGAARIEFTISSPISHVERYYQRLSAHPSVRLVDTIRDDEKFFQRIADADILLLPVNFDENSIRFIRYSMPTKVPAYLAVGTPILVYGPAGIAQVDYAVSEGWGLSVNQPNPQQLRNALIELSTNTALRQKLSQTAKLIAQSNHDVKKVRSRFQEVIMLAAQGQVAEDR